MNITEFVDNLKIRDMTTWTSWALWFEFMDSDIVHIMNTMIYL
jgi:hypothetical protein